MALLQMLTAKRSDEEGGNPALRGMRRALKNHAHFWRFGRRPIDPSKPFRAGIDSLGPIFPGQVEARRALPR